MTMMTTTTAATRAATNQRLMELVSDGWMLPEYAEDVRADAQTIAITPPGKRCS